MPGSAYGACYRTDQGPINHVEANVGCDACNGCDGCAQKRGGTFFEGDNESYNGSEGVQSRNQHDQPTCGHPDQSCFDSPDGHCCSIYGWCGAGPEYCSSITCDEDWGYCWSEDQSDSSEYLVRNSSLPLEQHVIHERDSVSVASTTVVVETSVVQVSVALNLAWGTRLFGNSESALAYRITGTLC